jgi:FkbM family methyltransferase
LLARTDGFSKLSYRMNFFGKLHHRWGKLKSLVSARRAALQLEREAINNPDVPVFSIQPDPSNFRRALLHFLDNRIFCPAALLKKRESSQATQCRRLVRKAMDRTSRPIRFQGRGFILEIPECFPHADEVVLNDFAEIYIENHYLAGFAYRPIEDGAVVLDCGANIGAFAVFAARLAADVRVLAFEPEPKTFVVLKRNVELNQLSDRVECLPFGLSNKAEVKTLLLNPDCFTTHHFADVTGVAVGTSQSVSLQIQCVTIDEIMAQRKIARCDLIKMDVEGSEGAALNGAVETIRRFRPRLSMAAYHAPEDAFVLPMMIRDICPAYNIIVSRGSHLYAFCQ